MNKNPEISIIIPVYGVEKYIKKCLESVKNQTFKDFECLVVDDGTLDNSIKIAQEVIKDDSRFIIINKENGGQGSARNLALDIAKGDYISFIDSDDYVEADYLKLMYEKIIEENADICTCDVAFVDEDSNVVRVFKNKINKYYEEDDYLQAKWYISNFMCDKLFKKEIFNNHRFATKLKTNEDVQLLFRIIYKQKIVSIENILYNYLQRKGSTSKDIHPTYIQDRIEIKNTQMKFIKENNLEDNIAYNNFVYLKTFIFYMITTLSRYSNNYKSDIEKLKKEIDINKFTLKNIIFMIKEEKKAGLSLLLFKISPNLFRLFAKFWFRNHVA